MSPTRQLAAIMFTDMEGYTALMQKNELKATQDRDKHRQVFNSTTEKHHGRILQYYGDGTLSIFDSAIDAVNCGIEMQIELQTNPIIPVRIGIHIGDVLVREDEIIGDGVNVAARIESMSVAGAILISGKLNDELKNHKAINTSSLGQFNLKNIAKPVEVFAIANGGIVVPQPEELIGKVDKESKTIAVLPFLNLSTSKDNEYFSDGLTEEIINALAKIKNLKVTSRTSSFYFKNKNTSIKQIANELNVSAILEGSVRLAGNTLRITAQLIQTEEDFHFWSESWDRKLENIFEIQDEISLLIADKLREQFGHFEIQEHLVEKQTDNIDAYEYSLKAKFHKNKWNPEDIRISITFYEKALELDPNHTTSLIGLADSYSFMAMTGFMSFEEAWGKSTQLIDKALLLDNKLAGANYQLANFALFTACDFRESFSQIKKAIEINPNYVESQQFMSFLYIILGEKVKSRNHLDIALALDPLSQETLFYSAYFEYMSENYNEALQQLNKCLAVNPKNIPALSVKSVCLLMLGKYDDVIRFFDEIPSDVVVAQDKTGTMALAYAFKKDETNSTKYFNLLLNQSKGKDGFAASSYLFLLYAAMGETEKAFEWVEDAIKSKSPLLLLRYADPIVNPIKGDPRYQKYQKIIFPQDLLKDEVRKKKVLLDEDTVIDYSKRLLNHIDENAPYLRAELSLRSLAEEINIHPNQLSWLLNERIGKNFNEFINHYRVEAFKQLATDPKNAHITLMGLAYDSGFNSKTVFNTYFKRETGLTPKQYLKQIN